MTKSEFYKRLIRLNPDNEAKLALDNPELCEIVRDTVFHCFIEGIICFSYGDINALRYQVSSYIATGDFELESE